MNITELKTLLNAHKKGEIFKEKIEHLLDCYQSRPFELIPYEANYIFAGIKGSGKTMLLRTCYYQLAAIFLMQCHLQQQSNGLPILVEFNQRAFGDTNAEAEWFKEFTKEIKRSVQELKILAQDPDLYVKRPLQILRETQPQTYLAKIANQFFDEDNNLIVSEEELRSSANGGIINGTLEQILGKLNEIVENSSGIPSFDGASTALSKWGRPVIFIDEMSAFTPINFYDHAFKGIFAQLGSCSNLRITFTVLPFSPADLPTKDTTFEKIDLSFNIRKTKGFVDARLFLKRMLEKLVGENELAKHMDIDGEESDAFEQLVFASNGIPRTCMEILIKALEKLKDDGANHNSFTISNEEIFEAIKSFGSEIYYTAIQPKKGLVEKANTIIDYCKGQWGFIFTVKTVDWNWIEVLRFNAESDPAIFLEDKDYPQKYSFHYAMCICLEIPTHEGGARSEQLVRKGKWKENIVVVDLS